MLLIFIATPVSLYAAEEEGLFAGGCFWCLEHDLESIPGVMGAKSGYSGGELLNPTYKNHEGHQESVLVHFENNEISYEELLIYYLKNIDPFDNQGQFCDRGNAYRPVIFTKNNEQSDSARKSLETISKQLDVPLSKIKVEIKEAKKFWIAENYHQNFAEKNKIKYKFYRNACGRDNRLMEVWGKDKG